MSNKAAVGGASKKSCLSEINKLQKDRDERRRKIEQIKSEKAAEEQRNRDEGVSGDVDFMRMISQYRAKSVPPEQVHLPSGQSKICICVRKRPISSKEIARDDTDSVTCVNPLVVVHDCKLKVDGISKYLDNNSFEFDHTFHEHNSTDNIYDCAVQPLVEFVLAGGRATIFAYGQTGSGKTFTMEGVQSYVADDLFALLQHHKEDNGVNTQVFVSYFEIYGGRCQDLLNSRQRLNVREDGNGEVVVSELMEMEATSVDALHAIIGTGNRNRTTHATESNDVSSRSHAICQIALRQKNKFVGRFSLIDLAGSERGADTKSHNRQRRMEGAEINKSLLALKECIRALDSSSSHVPYRASKLTLVLKDSFTNKKSKTVMIVNVSPAASSADHTLNTLRYADRIKERKVGGQAKDNARRNSLEGAAGGGGADAKAILVPKSDPNALPVAPGGGGGVNKDRDARNKEISKQLAENISAGNAAPPKAGGMMGGAGAVAGNRVGAADAKVVRSNAQQQQYKDEKGNGGNNAYYDDRFEDLPDDENNAFHRTVQHVFEEEEDLLNLHMTIIQENAELLTEEGRLLQQIQGENNDIDAYATRLDEILKRKQELITLLRGKLDNFRLSLQREERESRILANNGR
mmetsp:Transcript_21880/g.36614  ORF Transcript_21880/g.36614 Transcript_21880/m.36614 type:complete len:634 (+) Transcript_21880:62-1963(+)